MVRSWRPILNAGWKAANQYNFWPARELVRHFDQPHVLPKNFRGDLHYSRKTFGRAQALIPRPAVVEIAAEAPVARGKSTPQSRTRPPLPEPRDADDGGNRQPADEPTYGTSWSAENARGADLWKEGGTATLSYGWYEVEDSERY